MQLNHRRQAAKNDDDMQKQIIDQKRIIDWDANFEAEQKLFVGELRMSKACIANVSP